MLLLLIAGCVLLLLPLSLSLSIALCLPAATLYVLQDDAWNPSINQQALFRCYRYGQTRPVHVYRLLSAGTMVSVRTDRSLQ